jgi:hypothetical protein
LLPVSQCLFQTFLQAGFECSTHKRRNGERLDLVQSTQHDRLAVQDYRRISEFGIRTVRESARWHLIEQHPGKYTFESLDILFDAAAEAGVELILDLLHFGWPDHVDVLSPAFPEHFARFTSAVAQYIKRRGNPCRMFAPVNEISFLAWGGGEAACLNPYATDRAHDLKRNLVRSALVSSNILLKELTHIRLIAPEPVIHIVGNPNISGDDIAAENYRRAQFEAWDMLSGRLTPELGGRPEYIDIIGVNFYARNEWEHNAKVPLPRTDPRFRPFHKILEEVWDRYRRPIFVSETGTEDEARADWFDYVCDEVVIAHRLGIPVHGICLYPIVNHPGWEDDRHCYSGLFDFADEWGNREIHWPLAKAILNQQPKLQQSYQSTHDSEQHRSDLSFPSPMGIRFPATPTSHEPIRACPEGVLP